ncbi:MAG: hypothetical protein QOK44_4817 [Betaproteobacteria bacterium]|jgi:hypothetical protein|nr:hypothetical protein [Betaproteobacteria bacterium]
MKSIAVVLALSTMLAPHVTSAQSESRTSQASVAVSGGSATVVAGSLEIIAGSGELLVTGIETAGQATVVMLRSLSEAPGQTVKLSVDLARATSIAVGTVVQVVAASTGYGLLTAGQIIAFVPNEIGRALLYHKRRADLQ